MYSLTKIITTISLIAACAFVVTTARAVDPPPDGGYPNFNTAEGEDALFSLTTGSYNTALGFQALYNNTTQDNNTAVGYKALYSNNGLYSVASTAVGYLALSNNTTGQANMAIGAYALVGKTTGEANTASGWFALRDNTTGYLNTANGGGALVFNTTGNLNTADGADALSSNRTGSENTAIGTSALSNNTHGNFNTVIGTNAMSNNQNGSKNIALGYQAGQLLSGDGNIAIGNPGVRDEANTIRIGKTGIHTNTYISGISGITVAGGVGVIIDTDGHLGTVVSSERFKDAVRPMDKASESILALKPVTFRYKAALDPKSFPQFGLVAEQVAKVNPDLVARDEEGKPYTVRYEAVNAMLLNEFLKEHRKVEELEATVSAASGSLQIADRANPECERPA